MLCCTCGFLQDNAMALREAARAIELAPDRKEWLYDYATALRLSAEDDTQHHKRQANEIINAYKSFPLANPPDHRKVPEANYCIGAEYAFMGDNKAALKHFQLGLAAEEPDVRLPCFTTVADTFPPKSLLRLLQSTNAYETSQKESANVCSSCNAMQPPLRCPCNTAKYCNNACQRAHWPAHKKLCTAVRPAP